MNCASSVTITKAEKLGVIARTIGRTLLAQGNLLVRMPVHIADARDTVVL